MCVCFFLFFFSVLRVTSGPRVKLAGRRSALNLPIVSSTDRSKLVVLVLVLLFVALCGFMVPALLSVFFSVCCGAGVGVAVFGGCPIYFLFY